MIKSKPCARPGAPVGVALAALVVCLVPCLAPASAVASTVSGHIVGPDGAAVEGAQVFIESGMDADLIRAVTGSQGQFAFQGVAAGRAGVFAIADGQAFGGRTVTVGTDDAVTGVGIRLEPAGNIQGTVSNEDGEAVEGARITRVALLGSDPVGIPLAKLQAFGFEEPRSGAGGAFSVGRLPQGRQIALKIGHPQYAQKGVEGVTVGTENVRVALDPGTLVRGEVVSRDGYPVNNASVVFTNAEPPHDSVLSQSNSQGEFAVRLGEGAYAFRADAGRYSSPAWQQIGVSREHPQIRVTITVAAKGRITGEILDASTQEPVAGARLRLDAQGSRAAVVRTGASGRFSVDATVGENILRFESAAGYQPPSDRAFRVMVSEEEEVELPTMWLARVPAFRVEVVDAEMEPAPGVVITVLRPAQFGWRVTDADGAATIQVAALPEDGPIIGLAEHPDRPEGALFALERQDAGGARVQLLPLETVTGRVVDGRGRGLQGAAVAGMLYEDAETASVPLWRTVSQSDGRFEWPAAPARTPLQIVAAAGAHSGGAEDVYVTGESGEMEVALSGAGQGDSLLGKLLEWEGLPRLSGPPPEGDGRPMVLVYCAAAEAEMTAAGVAAAAEVWERLGVGAAVVADGPVELSSAGAPVLQGAPPGAARTYVLDSGGTVVFETFGLPPLQAVRGLAASE